MTESKRGLSKPARVRAMPRGPSPQVPQRGLGGAIQILREEKGVSRGFLAVKSQMESTALADIESGRIDPSWGSVKRLASALEVSLETLAALAENFEETILRDAPDDNS